MMIICRLETLELQHYLNGLNNIQFSYHFYVHGKSNKWFA